MRVLHVPCNPPLDAAYILLLFSFIGKNHRKKRERLMATDFRTHFLVFKKKRKKHRDIIPGSWRRLFLFPSCTAKDMYLRVPGLYCILLELAIPSTHTHKSVERKLRKKQFGNIFMTYWKSLDLLWYLFQCTFTFFFLAELFCEMLGHRKNIKRKRENNKKIKECEALNCVCVVCVCVCAADRETRPTTRAATSTLLLSVDGKQIY